ncbi:o-succinylbenzoate synthase [Halosegnis rubeus]|jgi:o-succinylbenzoate synthase|uniref:o-succinylbenzoate synthase n=1 Tax=Halosegnis rubeus TaxID=2212850 RepID=A0A5N5U2G8_9EURY|nr:o-succinylbenzoate synthase [Halosegnis rubeus]KAB7512675.1 o-succinylbenzoate synthase [Halosegnis rubeus]
MNFRPFAFELREPLATAAGDIARREGFLVTLDGDDGSCGVGEACPLPGWTESYDECRDALSDATPAELDTLPPAARHGLALALLDGDARDDGVPLYRHLGRDERVETVPANATVGDASTEQTRERVTDAVDEGYTCVKLKAANRPLDEDIKRVAAAREVAPDIGIRLDANGSWTRDTANRAFEKLAAFDVSYVEQPLPASDLGGLTALPDTGVGVALDEGLYEHGIDAVLDSEADHLVLKPMALGGPDVALELARLARGAGIEPVVTTTIDGPIARAAAVHVAAAIPAVSACGLATGSLLATGDIPDPAPVGGGVVTVPQKEGNTPAVLLADYA